MLSVEKFQGSVEFHQFAPLMSIKITNTMKNMFKTQIYILQAEFSNWGNKMIISSTGYESDSERDWKAEERLNLLMRQMVRSLQK